MIKLLETASSRSKKANINLTLEQLKELAEVLVDNTVISFFSKCFYDSFLDENYKKRKEQNSRINMVESLMKLPIPNTTIILNLKIILNRRVHTSHLLKKF